MKIMTPKKKHIKMNRILFLEQEKKREYNKKKQQQQW